MCEWLILKDVIEVIVATTGLLANGLNHHVAFVLWFLRTCGLFGFLICLTEALVLRYVTKVILKRIIDMNDALVGTWIKLSNLMVVLVLTTVHTLSTSFGRNVHFLTLPIEPFDDQGFYDDLRIPSILCFLHLLLALIIFVHVGIDKFKNRNSTPVIHIHIPNPQNQNQPPIVLNNQAYNQDLFAFSSYLTYLTVTIFFLPFVIIRYSYRIDVLAKSFELTESDFFTLFALMKNFTFTVVLGFMFPLIITLSSSELRPFLLRVMKYQCTNNELIDVYE